MAALLLSAYDGRTDDLPRARLWTVFPPGGQVGTSVTVTVTGADLDQATQLRFSVPGISATQLTPETNATSSAVSFRVKIDETVQPGLLEVRVLGRFGISNPRAFCVGLNPELTLAGTNNSPSTAVSLLVGTLVNGRAESASATYYKFFASSGDRMLVECAAQSIDSRMDPTLFVYDANGNELERSRRGHLLDFTAPIQGEYLLKAHDSLFRGGSEFFYRLVVSRAPHIDYIIPMAGQAGSRGHYSIFGRNLPGGVPVTALSSDRKRLSRVDVEIDLPTGRHDLPSARFSWPLGTASTDLECFDFRLSSTNGLSNPVPIYLTKNPVLQEKEPNDSSETSQAIVPPWEVEGSFFPLRDRDCYTLSVSPGKQYDIQLISHRLGKATDPFMLFQTIRPGQSNETNAVNSTEVEGAESNPGGIDANVSHRDPEWHFQAQENRAYQLQLRDHFNSGQPDPDRSYRLIVREAQPEIRLLVVPQAPPQLDRDRREARVNTVFLRRGELFPLKVVVFRKGGFAGDVLVQAKGLPTGLRCDTATIRSNNTVATLFLRTDRNLPPWSGTLSVVGKAQAGTNALSAQASFATIVWDVNDYNLEPVRSRLNAELAVALSADEFAPLEIRRQEEGELTAARSDKLRIPLNLSTNSELVGNLKIKAAGVTEFNAMNVVEVNATNRTATLELDLPKLKVSNGLYDFYVFVQGQCKYRRIPNDPKAATEERSFTAYSPLIRLNVSDSTATLAATKKKESP